ncbi:M23 family metallopeptidase [Thermomonas sp. HDW16]|uniref:M23 family metallopeptidase n=1 Tax=Thermomonas sp. HDW16 TaxID=2714945 RepID=UPI001408E8BC|nr:M23 family metallopeptidase [Thermomonas sp. HDW16]QIL19378.1 M23 family metallopeptidase [Thermomonas sp. HDW16]
MRRERKPSPLRGLLLFLLGALVGANAVYFVMSRERAAAAPPSDSSPPNRVEIPLPIGNGSASTPTPPAQTPPVLPAPRVSATGTGTTAVTSGALLIPVQGVTATQLLDTFTDARSAGRSHDAIDIMAAAGTPVFAVADGHVEKLFDSKQGGITLYQFDPQGTRAYYYAHLQGYAAGIAEKKALKRGELIGYVGSTGNASAEAPHLHFAIFVLGPEKQWWKGEAINPYPLLGGVPR